MLLGTYLADRTVEGPILLKISRISSIILIIMLVDSRVLPTISDSLIAISHTWDSNSTLITTFSWTRAPIQMPPPATLLGVDLRRLPDQSRVPIRVYQSRAPTDGPTLLRRASLRFLRKFPLTLKGRLLHLTLPIPPVSAPKGL